MDRAPLGPLWLNDPEIAAVVKETLLAAGAQWKLFDLAAWVVMANHVHVLFQPHKKPTEIMGPIKSAGGRDANRIRSRAGQAFWQAESYDRWVRDRKEFDKIAGYIEATPVSAGLVTCAADWPWSSPGGAGPLPATECE